MTELLWLLILPSLLIAGAVYQMIGTWIDKRRFPQAGLRAAYRSSAFSVVGEISISISSNITCDRTRSKPPEIAGLYIPGSKGFESRKGATHNTPDLSAAGVSRPSVIALPA